MRSRYTAYVRRDEAYLLRTWEASHRPESLDLDDAVWLGLEVLATEAGGADDAHGLVEFVASYEDRAGAVDAVRERSRFVMAAGAWVYVDGVHVDGVHVDGVHVNEVAPREGRPRDS